MHLVDQNDKRVERDGWMEETQYLDEYNNCHDNAKVVIEFELNP